MDSFTIDDIYVSMKFYVKLFKPFLESLSYEEVDTLVYYKQNGYIDINDILYGNKIIYRKKDIPVWFYKEQYARKLNDIVIERIKALDSVFAKIPLKIQQRIPKYLYRGTPHKTDLKVGELVTSKGFLSTSLFPHVASKFIGCEGCCIVKFLMTKPIPYVYLTWDVYPNRRFEIEKISNSEVEFMLPRNIRFRVIEKTKVSLNRDHIHCSIKDIEVSKRKKLTMYVCEFVDILEDISIPTPLFSLS